MKRRRFLQLGAAAAVLPSRLLLAQSGDLDLRACVVLLRPGAGKREEKAAQVLVEEAEKRCGIRWPIRSAPANTSQVAIVLGTRRGSGVRSPRRGSEDLDGDSYILTSDQGAGGPRIFVTGATERGLLFGVGRFLRLIEFGRQTARLSTLPLHVVGQPEYRLRGHQLGYRPKTNSYDGWTVPMWDQYIRDLAVFGVNSIELLPPHTDDLPDSPMFPLPPQKMMVEMSRIADSYGLDVWMWYPAMERDYSDPATVARSLDAWGKTFAALPRLDAVFVPGGDPGHTEPKVLLALLQAQKQNLRKHHPDAQIWVSPQGFNAAWMSEFLELVGRESTREWLDGIVYGPMCRLPEAQLRQALPQSYPIRCYPDITHSLQCQYPVPDWDVAYALTEGREIINPRPRGEAAIARGILPGTIGFLTYSEGCNDDVNKFVWSAMGWDSKQDIEDVLRDFAHYFIGGRETEGFAQGLLSLESNWGGPLAVNRSVEVTLQQFRDMESNCLPAVTENWRFQQALYRAYYDAYVRSRLLQESGKVQQAREMLAQVFEIGWGAVALNIGGAPAAMPPNGLLPDPLLAQTQAALEEQRAEPAASELRARVLELGAALFQSIRMQLAVERYAAEAVSRGANLDTLDTPVANTLWMRRQIIGIRALAQPAEQVAAMRALLSRTDPGAGGFYDQLGSVSSRPHLVLRDSDAPDPDFRTSVLIGFNYPDTLRDQAPVEWKCWAETLYDTPLVLRYTGLDKARSYRLRVVHSGDSPQTKLRLVANDTVQIHPYLLRAWPPAPQEFAIPRAATAGGELKLAWNREPGLGGNGSGCQVAEVWLIPQPAVAHD